MTEKCRKPGCGAQKRVGSPCTDWDCPQRTIKNRQELIDAGWTPPGPDKDPFVMPYGTLSPMIK